MARWLMMWGRLVNNLKDPAEGGAWADELWALVAQGVLRQSVFKEYPLTADGVRQTSLDQKGRASTGKLLVRIAPEDD